MDKPDEVVYGPVPPAHVVEWVKETYRTEGVEIWLRGWRNADQHKRATLAGIAENDGMCG